MAVAVACHHPSGFLHRQLGVRGICETEGRQMAMGDIHKSMFPTSMVTDLSATNSGWVSAVQAPLGIAGFLEAPGFGEESQRSGSSSQGHESG